MTTSRRTFVASVAGVGLVSASALAYRVFGQVSAPGAGHSTPEGSPEALACHVAEPAGTPGVVMGTPMAEIDYDVMYLDMMIPHIESIIALAEVATEELEDERLIAFAKRILETRPADVDTLRQYRDEWYGDPEPGEMTLERMSMVMGSEHDCGDQGHMDQMRAGWQLERFGQADDKDMAFINQVVAHHWMEINTAEVALEYAEREEIRTFAEEVIATRTALIDELESIREEMLATPDA